MANPPPKQIVISDKKINGPLHAVPCPWCGKSNDCRNLHDAIKSAMEAGATFWCDHCHHLIVVTKIAVVTVVECRQSKQTGVDPSWVAAQNQQQGVAPPAAPKPTNPLAALLKPRR